jgi:uncharacterized membrane protein
MIALSSQAIAALSAAFLGSLVEAVETLTIVLAVGSVRGWRPALIGTASGLVVLLLLVVLLGPLLALVPIRLLQLVVGTLLLLFGIRWLRKAILRAAGIVALHDEEAAFAEERSILMRQGMGRDARLYAAAVATTFKAVLLEGIEVVFIVIAVGAVGDTLLAASAGAALACLLVVIAGLIVHRPLTRVPENTLKFAVGVMLSAFGVFWVAEGLGFAWPGHDLAIPVLALGFLVVGLLAVAAARRMAARAVAIREIAG